MAAPFAVAERSCYVVYLGDEEPVEIRGTPREVRLEAQRRMAEQQKANAAASSGSLAKKLVDKALLARRKGSIVSAVGDEAPPSRVNLLDLPVEILQQILSFVGAKNFYDAPERLLVCRRYQHLARPLMERRVELDVNSLQRFVPAQRTSMVRKILRRNSEMNNGGDRSLLRPARVQHFDADLRIINGFITLNNVPVARNNDYRRWKSDIDSSFEWLAGHAHEFSQAKTFRLRAWTPDCLIAESRGRQWSRLCREMVSDLATGAHNLDRVELDFCGTGFTWMRCGWQENRSSCEAIRTMLRRVRVLWLRMQSMCPHALDVSDLEPTAADDKGDNDDMELDGKADADRGAADVTPRRGSLRLQELIINKDIWEANPWSHSGAHGGRCLRPEGIISRSAEPLPSAMRRVLRQMHDPRRVRFLWHDNEYERRIDKNAKLPMNKKGHVAYVGAVAYDIYPTHRVSRLGFLAPWDSEGTVLEERTGSLWAEDEREGDSDASRNASSAQAG